ncbi:MAG: putative RNase H-like nuclease (RuvC/YqgF family) [Saprospiraceae bacterium]|jgi:predicted RNase H-like nuclease (RuvC/YqgF family)
MNKTLAIIIGSVLAVSLTTVTIASYNKSKTLQKEVVEYKSTIDKLAEDNTEKDEQIEDLKIEVSELKSHIAEYETTIARLEKQVKGQASEIRSYKRKIAKRNKTIDDLKKEITLLSRERKDNTAKIKELEAQKRDLLARVKKYDGKLGDTIEKKKDNTDDIRLAKIEKMRQERIADIVTHTNIAFVGIEARERKDSKEMRKIKPKKWRYTNLQFHLQHKEGPRAIMDEEFAVIIRDLDSGKVLPFNEGNPVAPGNKIETGFPITYNGNMFMVDYYNSELKKGKNFAVEIYYVLGGKHYAMPGGTKKIISKGKVVKL